MRLMETPLMESTLLMRGRDAELAAATFRFAES